MEQKQLEAMIVAAKNGSAEAYKALLETYWPRLYKFFLRAAGNHHDAEDLLGELALRVVRRLKSYDERGRFEAWLFRIAANLVRDRIRRIKATPAIASISAETDRQVPRTKQIAGRSEDVDKQLIEAEMFAKANDALRRLDDTSRQMVLLRLCSEMSFKEIAEIYGCPIGTALAKVRRGLIKLREFLALDIKDGIE